MDIKCTRIVFHLYYIKFLQRAKACGLYCRCFSYRQRDSWMENSCLYFLPPLYLLLWWMKLTVCLNGECIVWWLHQLLSSWPLVVWTNDFCSMIINLSFLTELNFSLHVIHLKFLCFWSFSGHIISGHHIWGSEHLCFVPSSMWTAFLQWQLLQQPQLWVLSCQL